MSTPNTTPLSTTPATDEDVMAYVRQIAAEEAAKIGVTNQTPPTPEPLKMNIGGQEHSFKDLNEAQAYMNNTIGQFQTQLNQRQAPVNQGREATKDTDTFDQKRYVDYMVEDPRKAADYMDEYRFGVKDPVNVIKARLAQVDQLAQEAVVNAFKTRHADWDDSQENANAMQTVMNELGLSNVISPATLDAAFTVAKTRGLIKTNENAAQNRQEPNNYAPPVAARGRAANPYEDLVANAETMPLADLEKVIARFSR